MSILGIHTYDLYSYFYLNQGANTRGLEGAVSIYDCECVNNMYMTKNRTGELGMRCFTCPAAAVCPDGSCGLRNAPRFTCDGIGSEDMPNVVGTWVRGENQQYRVIDCPIGHQLISTTGYELQECAPCSEGKYITVSNDPGFRCYRCPASARCPNRGPPVFPESEVKGELNLGGELLPEEDLLRLIAASLGLDYTMVAIDDYDNLAESLLQRRGLNRWQRREFRTYQVKFSVWTSSDVATTLQSGLKSAISNFSQVLAQIAPDAVMVGAGATSMTSRLPGEEWREVEGAFALSSCPVTFVPMLLYFFHFEYYS